jgi:DNA helicase HerA-like ATPase
MRLIMNSEQILEDSIFKIGKVIAVEGRSIKIEVDKTKNSSHLIYKGELLKNVSVGGYVKIIKGFTKIIGKVEGEFVEEDKLYSAKIYASKKEKVSRVLHVSLLGFFRGFEFERGIKELPLIDNECFLLHNAEFDQVHNFIKKGDKPITIGTLSLEKGQEIQIGINSLFASHIGIFGNTGSGKSYTLAKIYRELFEIYKESKNFQAKAQFFLLDFNGEYVDEDDHIIIEKEYKNIYKISTRTAEGGTKFPVSKEALDDPSFWIVFLDAKEKTQEPFIHRVLRVSPGGGDLNDFVRNRLDSLIRIVIDKKDKNLGAKILLELFFDLFPSIINQSVISEIIEFLETQLGFNGSTGSYYVKSIAGTTAYNEENIRQYIIQPLTAMITRLEFLNEAYIDVIRLKMIMKYYAEIIRGHSNKEHISPLIKRLDTRIKDLKKILRVAEVGESRGEANFTIISLRDVNMSIRKILPLLLCKNLYDEKKKAGDEETYLNIIIDEAHNILSEDSVRESEHWKDHRLETFEEIIKEGRKFGVFLTIASQRPSDISSTVISQLHNFFLHRLINNEDIRAIEKTISYLDKVSFGYLPILPTGTCILAGLLAQIPVVVDVGKIPVEYEPRNKTMTLIEKWSSEDNETQQQTPVDNLPISEDELFDEGSWEGPAQEEPPLPDEEF